MGKQKDLFQDDSIKQIELKLNDKTLKKLLGNGYIGEPMKVIMTFVDGYLTEITGLETVTKYAQTPTLAIPFPPTLELLPHINDKWDYFTYQELNPSSTYEKIKVFTAAYKSHFKEGYVVQPKESGLWDKNKRIPGNSGRIDFYFQCKEFPFEGPKTISEYVSRHNELIQMMQRSESRFPDYFDKILYDGLPSKQKPAYEMHLVKLGYVKEHRGTSGTTFIKKNLTERRAQNA